MSILRNVWQQNVFISKCKANWGKQAPLFSLLRGQLVCALARVRVCVCVCTRACLPRALSIAFEQHELSRLSIYFLTVIIFELPDSTLNPHATGGKWNNGPMWKPHIFWATQKTQILNVSTFLLWVPVCFYNLNLKHLKKTNKKPNNHKIMWLPQITFGKKFSINNLKNKYNIVSHCLQIQLYLCTMATNRLYLSFIAYAVGDIWKVLIY